MAGEYAGFSVPRPTDQEKAAVRELMFTHACFVVSALDERFPQADLVHSFRIFYPSSYRDVDSLVQHRQLLDFGQTDLSKLADHFGGSKTPSEGDEIEPMVDKDCLSEEFIFALQILHAWQQAFRKFPIPEAGRIQRGRFDRGSGGNSLQRVFQSPVSNTQAVIPQSFDSDANFSDYSNDFSGLREGVFDHESNQKQIVE